MSFVGFVVLIKILFSNTAKCKACGGKLEIVEKKLIDKQDGSITKTLYKRNKDSEIISSQDVLVPAIFYKYEICKKCKKCGNVETTEEIVKEEK